MRKTVLIITAALLAGCASRPPMPAAGGEEVEAAVQYAEREAAQAKSRPDRDPLARIASN